MLNIFKGGFFSIVVNSKIVEIKISNVRDLILLIDNFLVSDFSNKFSFVLFFENKDNCFNSYTFSYNVNYNNKFSYLSVNNELYDNFDFDLIYSKLDFVRQMFHVEQ